ncbi:putative wsc domain protein [Staphylotrichum tortipilum]|uniref:Wsc domain protein n=1 Tax=Staphylotrichum tortipilum TaxID=2831512 RepID=A0AAN6RQG6_9PEZI|nr:putative wsc domain protein [Staphylotrichum longicolle]
MKASSTPTTLLLSLAALTRRAAADPYPNFQWDPNTAADCVEWYDHSNGETCEHIRSYFTITPEQFHAWNPSLGLDCSGWLDRTSYCIVTLGRMQDTYKSRSITFRPTTATVTGYSRTYTTTYTPTPTIWRSIGCHALGGLDERVTIDVGKLTPEKCQSACWSSQYQFAGLMAGNQCWCAVLADGEKRDSAACSVSCEGDSGVTCGGVDAVELFWKETMWVTTTASSGGGAVATPPPAGTAVGTTASSGAGRKRVVFGMLG